jgi:4-nitrophenyl phosphatase
MSAQIASIQSIIIDLDGVLWRGAKPLPGVAGFFGLLEARAIRFLVVTNNATRTAESVAERLATIGVSVPPSRILTSAKALVFYLREELPAGSRLLVIGEEGLLDTLVQAGFLAAPADSADEGISVAAVVVGLDRGVTYHKLAVASTAIRAGARFVATNTDATLPTEDGVMPGAGAIVAAVQTATSVLPTVIGKPHRPMFKAALEILKTAPERTAMLGDRLDTDIQGAQAVGLTTILVFTGVTTIEEARASTIKPDFAFANLIELKERWEGAPSSTQP